MYKFNNNNLTFDEWIRLNNIDIPQIIEASETIASLECIVEEQQEEIEQLKLLINSFDFETLDIHLDNIELGKHSLEVNLMNITRILHNYRLRIKDI